MAALNLPRRRRRPGRRHRTGSPGLPSRAAIHANPGNTPESRGTPGIRHENRACYEIAPHPVGRIPPRSLERALEARVAGTRPGRAILRRGRAEGAHDDGPRMRQNARARPRTSRRSFRRGVFPRAAVIEAKALPVHLEDMDVMDEPVEQRSGQALRWLNANAGFVRATSKGDRTVLQPWSGPAASPSLSICRHRGPHAPAAAVASARSVRTVPPRFLNVSLTPRAAR